MSDFYQTAKKATLCSTFLLLFCFTGIANATFSTSDPSTSLSGIEPGFPRFIAKKVRVNYYNAGGNTFYFDSWNTNKRVFWQENETMSKERIKSRPIFYTQVDIDASDPTKPKILDGSFFKVWGKLKSENTGKTLLFKTKITDLFWDTRNKIVEFILDGDSQEGAVCDLGFCSFTDELLQFKMRRFNGKWDRGFRTNASAIATVPLPAAFWLLGTAMLGLSAFQRRKSNV